MNPDQHTESVLVYWCKNDQWFVPLGDGSSCPNDDCVPDDNNWRWDANGLIKTRMRKRRGWVCTERWCGSIVFGTKTYAMSYYRENHVHYQFD